MPQLTITITIPDATWVIMEEVWGTNAEKKAKVIFAARNQLLEDKRKAVEAEVYDEMGSQLEGLDNLILE